MELVDGALLFLISTLVLVVAVIHCTYSRTGGGINGHPSGRPGDPGARRTYDEGISYLRVRGTR